MHMSRWLAALVLGLGLAIAATAQDKITLKVNYEPGTYLLTHQTQADTTTSGYKATLKSAMTLVAQMEIAKADDKGNREVKFTYKRVKTDMRSGDSKYTYDSAVGGNETIGPWPANKILGAMIDKTLTMTLDSKGRVSNIKGTDEMVDAMVKDAGLPEAVSAELKKQYGQKKIEELFSIMHMFPDKPVAKGDKWDITKKMRDGATDFTQTYTLKDIKDKMAIIAFTGTLKMATTASGPAGQTVTMKQMNDVSGTSQVNIDTGMVKQMDMTLKGSGTSGNESTFTFDMKVALTIEKGTYKAPTTTKAAQ